MLESKNTQFSLSAEGKILWQEKINNPVPGVPVAVLKKGDHPLKPIVTVIESDVTSKHDGQDVLNHVKLWLKGHLTEIIEALVLLEIPGGVEPKDDVVSKIAARMYDGMGIVPREDLEDLIAALTPETRAELRSKKIRLGPVLAFMPDLNKPAAVRLRALLLSVFNGYALPANVPSDGIVSVKIEDAQADPAYYRAIGYPLYGGRAVRIDMLDRVISCVYDHADKGKFQARHEMAEWLGCSIEDLYKVLESMGHTKIYDPAEQEPKETDEAKVGAQDEAVQSEVAAEVAPAVEMPSAEAGQGEKPESKPEKKPEVEKPELATFKLKKGKAFQSGKEDSGKKPFTKYKKEQKNDAPKKSFKKKGDKGKPKDTRPRVISAEAKKSEDDSPFAILQQLKK
tara:strand:- start:22781 stop:23971 length:1191 start_codon:yes stop_codon:yes gene_type:complete